MRVHRLAFVIGYVGPGFHELNNTQVVAARAP
jgi:hypothetical protein